MAGIFHTLKKNILKKQKDGSPGVGRGESLSPRTVTAATSKSNASVPSGSSSNGTNSGNSNAGVEDDENMYVEDLHVLCRAVAICDYHPTDVGNYDDIRFLEFEKGAVIDVLEQDASGWWEGILNGFIGVFPGSYVRVSEIFEATSSDEATAHQSQGAEGEFDTTAVGSEDGFVAQDTPGEYQETPSDEAASGQEHEEGGEVRAVGDGEATSQMKNLQKELSDRNKEVATLKMEVKRLKAQADEKEVLEVKLSASQEEASKAKQQLHGEIEKRQQMEAEVTTTKSRVAAEVNERKRLEEALSKAEQEAEEAWAAHNTLLQQLQVAKENDQRNVKTELAKQLEEEINLRTRAEQSFRSIELEVIDLRKQKQQLHAQLETTKSDSEHLKQDIEKLSSEKQQLQTQLEEVRQDLKIARIACVAQSKDLEQQKLISDELTLANAQLQEDLLKTKLPTTDQSQLVEKLTAAKRQMEAQVSELRKSLSKISTEKETYRQEMEHQISQLKSQLEAESTKRKDADAKLVQFQRRAETSARQTKDSSEEELIQLRQRYEKLMEDKRKVDEELKLVRTAPEGVLVKEISQLHGRIEVLKKEKQELQNTLNKQREAQANIIKIETESSALQVKLEQEIAAKRQLEENEKSLRVELGIAQKRLNNATGGSFVSTPSQGLPIKYPKTSAPVRPISRQLPSPPVFKQPLHSPSKLIPKSSSPAPSQPTPPTPGITKTPSPTLISPTPPVAPSEELKAALPTPTPQTPSPRPKKQQAPSSLGQGSETSQTQATPSSPNAPTTPQSKLAKQRPVSQANMGALLRPNPPRGTSPKNSALNSLDLSVGPTPPLISGSVPKKPQPPGTRKLTAAPGPRSPKDAPF
eukprot:TRINITY_DN16340_c0_g1_i1.p1 TRINITY_DN16340_c0_g1~~TRINITY_DN16340_c0_g1_i1.p1  ORF type:complete len:866 (-),score=259.34 TRINITY_DN16340_c0_g1_i1:114-2711(-)